jgi:hypothetical protein
MIVHCLSEPGKRELELLYRTFDGAPPPDGAEHDAVCVPAFAPGTAPFGPG